MHLNTVNFDVARLDVLWPFMGDFRLKRQQKEVLAINGEFEAIILRIIV